MKYINRNELELLALGSAVLGSGGGGDPAYDLLMAQHALDQYGPVRLLHVEELQANDLVAPFEFIGAPLIAMEQLPNGEEFIGIVARIEQTMGRPLTALLPGEIGGGNAFTPFLTAARLGLPLVDGDLLGRAFPQIQMSSTELFGIAPCPAFLADSLGNMVVVHAKSSFELEKIARQIAVAMGSHCAMASYLMCGAEARQAVISGSISKAIEIGTVIQNAQKQAKSPTLAVIDLCGGVHLAQGVIIEVQQAIQNGFLEGTVQIQAYRDIFELIYQNEFLLARRANEVLATTPDILVLLECESGTPITSESLRYGLRVDLMALPAPKIWTSASGLKLVGPEAFGFGMSYQSVKSR